jgi:uncharacterized Zn-binding protein involved in type VI secretion
MPGACRLGDKCTGHSCFPPRINSSASSDVIVNGKGWHRKGDSWVVHCCGKYCHGGILNGSSSSVFINKRGAGRIGDSVSCGSAVSSGSGNVFAGG